MVDYILTVAVSISAGVAAIVSIPAFSGLADHRVALGRRADRARSRSLNMRGIKESGTHLRGPHLHLHGRPRRARRLRARTARSSATSARSRSTRSFAGDVARVGGTLGIFLLLKGFSSGAVALTGVEAISNGVPAFRRPESKNAATTLVWMGVLLGTLFFGISVLAHRLAARTRATTAR